MTAKKDKARVHDTIDHPRLELNEAIHQPVRLSIMAILAHAKKTDFAFLREYLGLSDSNLSHHLLALEGLGYIVIEKVFEGKRARTWVVLSASGRTAFEDHVRILHAIVEHPFGVDEDTQPQE
jgi:DNA-binding transcriptional ArsR family regulator